MRSTAVFAGTPLHAWAKACGVCRRTYGAGEWGALPVVAQLAPAAVQGYLSVPASWSIELRRCACGVPLAARRALPGPDA